MKGFPVLVLKELLESWRTRRLPAVAAVFLIFIGIMSPLTARYLPEILKAALGSQLTIPIPIPTAADSIGQVQKNLGQFGALAAIVLAMGAVAAEKERGTAAFILTKPATRGAFIAAKIAVLAIVLGIATLLAVAVAWIYTGLLFEPQSIIGWFDLAVLAWLGLMVWAAITFLASTVSGSSMVAAGIGVLALLGLSIVAVVPQIGRFLPAGLEGPARSLALGGTAVAPGPSASGGGLSVDLGGATGAFDAGVLATAVAGCLAIVVVATALSWGSFRRQEL